MANNNSNNNNNGNNNTLNWFFPYGKPNATSNVYDNPDYFSDELNPLFNNVQHPYNPQYSQNNIKMTNHNMLNGQPNYQVAHLHDNYTNANGMFDYMAISMLAGSQKKNADINWKTNVGGVRNDDYHPYHISPNFRALPDLPRKFENPEKPKGDLITIIPKDMFNQKSEKDDEYFNERNFQEIFNHPFYNQMQPFLEQPYKSL